jgi:hypothetical protein
LNNYLFSLGYYSFYIQYEDNYSFRPSNTDFYDINKTKNILSNTIPKKDWGYDLV